MKKAKRFIALFLATLILIPTNLAEAASEKKEVTPEIKNSAPNGMSIHAEWEGVTGDTYELSEANDSSNAVKLKISYSDDEVQSEGYKPGELIITVKGIGGVNRNGPIKATVAADEAGSAAKQRDWTYTWNKSNDTYTFVNNEEIKPNSVYSGYFEMVWDIKARDSIHGYSQDDVLASFLLPDGTNVETKPLKFSNRTTVDTFKVDISTSDMYSSHGFGIQNPDEYIFVKYYLSGKKTSHSRGLSSGEQYTLNIDTDNLGNGAIVKSPVTGVSLIEGNTYSVNMYSNTSRDYVYVAYPKEIYGNKTVNASLTISGAFYEGDNDGNTDITTLASDDVDVFLPLDFEFSDNTGEIYAYSKDSYHDRYWDPDVEERGGEVNGQKLTQGHSESFYLNSSLNVTEDALYTLEMIDDFLYITENDGDYRQLEAGEYHFESLSIPSSTNILNENGFAITAGKYPIKVYAISNGQNISISEDTLYWEGILENYSQGIDFPKDTTAIAIRIEGLEESVDDIEFITDVNFHLENNQEPDSENAPNLKTGKIVNTTFIKVYDKANQWINNDFNESNYDMGMSNLDLAKKDIDIYGAYLDREKADFTLYAGEKSEYRASTSLSEIEYTGKQYEAELNAGANFDFKEEEIPNQFSLYTILPDGIQLKNYKLEEQLWDNIHLSGMSLTPEQLTSACIPEVIQDYQGSGRIYIALHFDLSQYEIPQKTNIHATIGISMKRGYFKKASASVYCKSAVMMDKDVNAYVNHLSKDEGKWEEPIASDIDRDGNITEYLDYDYDYSNYIYVDSSQFQLTKYVDTEYTDDYTQLPEIPSASYGSDYSYMLTLKNGNSIGKNIKIKDVLENGENHEWKGILQSVEIDAPINGTVKYADSTTDQNWSTTLAPSKAKSILVEFENEELKAGQEINIIVHMKAPSDKALKNKITENNYKVAMTMVDNATGNETIRDNLESNYVQVKLTPALRNLIIIKEDETDGSRLSGAEFELMNGKESIGKAVTNDKGIAIFENIPEDETYLLKETAAPVGYELVKEQEIKFDQKDLRIKISDPRKRGTIEIYKTNSMDNLVKVEGAEYTLYNSEGKEIDVVKTNINGKAIFEQVNWGKYTIKETKAPSGYELNEKVYNVEITRENVSEIQKINTTDKQHNTKVTLIKYEQTTEGVQTEIPLQGAAFDLIKTTDGSDANLGTYVTDKQGSINVEGLSYGTYIFREIRIPQGFEKVENIEFSITPDKKNVNLVAYNQRKSGTIRVYKTDNLGNQIENVVFELYDETKANVLGVYTTNKSGAISIPDLEWGQYYLKEKSTPECYVLDSSWVPVVIDAKNITVQVNLVNQTKKGTIVLEKTDEIGQNFLKGAVFSLYKEDGTIIAEGLTTDDKGRVKVSDLEWGKYYFKETKAPVGYGRTDETVRFAVNSLNAGTVQSIQVTNPQDSRIVTLTKRLRTDEINFANGNPTFLFQLSGTDVNGDTHTYHRIVTFDEAYVKANTDAEGFVSQSVTFSGFPAGNYTASEEKSSRYEVSFIDDNSENGVIKDTQVLFELVTSQEGSARFTNTNHEQQFYSDTSSVANVIKKQMKLTGLKVLWKGDKNVTARTEIDRNLIEATAIYDDGSTKLLENSEYAFGESFKGIKFPNLNGDYEIPITYTENGITKTASFDVTISGAVKEIVQLEASVLQKYETVRPGASLTNEMFDVWGIYNTGEKVSLNAITYPVITSPNYPDNYPNGMKEEENTWTKTIPNAHQIKVIFSKDSVTESSSYDWVYVKDGTGKAYGGKLGGTSIGGKEITVDGDTVSISMRSDSSGQRRGFSAQLIPLDETGQVIPETSAKYTFTPDTAPEQEGIFKVNITMVNELDETISTSVNVNVKYPEPILETGLSFNKHIPDNVTSIVFTDEKAPENSTITDISYKKDSSVVSWIDGTTMKVSSQRKGVKVVGNPDCNQMFYYKEKLTSIDFTYFNTSNVTNMGYMFYSCWALTQLDVSSFDTSNVTNMSSMFAYCRTLTQLDVSSFDTSNVTNMYSMFYNCRVLTQLGLTNFDTSQVMYMNYMFKDCSALTQLDVSSFDTSNVTRMLEMFNNCKALTQLDVSSFDTSNVTDMGSMFKNCNALTQLDVSSFNTSNVTDMGYMFYSCFDLTQLDVSNFDTSKVTDMGGMFNNCKALTQLDVSSFDTSNVTNMYSMFYNCRVLTQLGLTNFDTSQVTHMGDMFEDCKALTQLDVSNFDTSKVTDMGRMFSGCSALTQLDLTNFDTSQVTRMGDMFSFCFDLTQLDVSSFDTSNVTDMGYMFYSCYDLTQLDISSFDTSNVTDMNLMFCNCNALNQVLCRTQSDLDNFKQKATKTPSNVQFVLKQ